ncbi:MAG: phospholipid carrier-dependent glycosyltransferase [Cyanobacteria bacterium P01_F01_bin.53]
MKRWRKLTDTNQSRFFSDQKNIIKARLLRILAGIALGAAVATKWNGLGYALSLWVWENWQRKKETQGETEETGTNRAFFQWKYIVYGLFIPGVVYGLSWWPHLWLTGERFGDVHATLLNFHYQLDSGGHAACSRWYTWPLLTKPFPYWYEEAGASVHTVNNMGNPLLWWLSSAAMMLLVIEGIGRLKDKRLLRRAEAFRMTDLSLYLVIGYVSNWLPWVLISRCTYIYLYMPAAVFSFMVLAWLLSEWLHSPVRKVRAIGWIVLGAIALAAWFWLPLALGSPLSPEGLRMRWWLRSWI